MHKSSSKARSGRQITNAAAASLQSVLGAIRRGRSAERPNDDVGPLFATPRGTAAEPIVAPARLRNVKRRSPVA